MIKPVDNVSYKLQNTMKLYIDSDLNFAAKHPLNKKEGLALETHSF